jgi:hypothetical protein
MSTEPYAHLSEAELNRHAADAGRDALAMIEAILRGDREAVLYLRGHCSDLPLVAEILAGHAITGLGPNPAATVTHLRKLTSRIETGDFEVGTRYTEDEL